MNDKLIPVLYSRKEECCGCTACYAICPKNAISMQSDVEGFLYPVIDANHCIRCGSCLRVCPIKKVIDGYILKHDSDGMSYSKGK